MGSHIASLLLRFFILYMPQLIQAGKVYKALPPLYSVSSSKKIQYFTDQFDFVRYVQKNFVQNNILKDPKTKQNIPGKDITLIFMYNEDYVYELERLALTYGVEPSLLELALYSYYEKTSLNALKKSLKNKFRFMDVTEKKGIYTFDGTIQETNFLFMNERLINDGKPSTIYDVMKAFDKSTPSNIQRYKGLGEMNADRIAVSTLRPDSDRTLIRYTLEDAKEELSAIREFESDRSKLLEFVGIVKRVDLFD